MASTERIQDRALSMLAPAASAGERYLAIYMNDQLALGVLWREIARRSARSNHGTDTGEAIGRVAAQISEDVDTFEEIMQRIGVPRTPAKPVLAVAGERLGRMKLNGHLRGYSPLSRFEELDFLVMGIDGKVVLWTNLRDHAGLAERLPDVDFDALIDRARRQRTLLEPFHAEAGREALGGAPAA
ncbi:MAG: hypothetical protein QOE11_2347 [Solirubrobacteraceae bacterium]|jgi:hypothetical protein|nr:hypothetical protein [Solirubrobacteraceae bacterium]